MAQTKIEQGLLKFTDATDYLKIPTGTTAQRPSSPANGYIRFNTTINDVEAYNGTEWTRMGIAPPTFTSVDYPGSATALDPAGGESLVINGTNFNTGITITIDGTTPSSITLNSSTQLTVTAPAKSAGTYNIVFTNTDGGTATAINAVSYNGVPSWTTAAGNLGSVDEGASISFTVTATEPDGGAITYAVTSGALPSGASLNTSTGAITGTASAVNATTTSTFTITATDNENQTAAREFNIIVENDGPSKHFNIATWTGDGTTNRDISAGFEPALGITKKRSTTSSWYVLDSIRGNGTYIYTDTTGSNDYNANHANLTSTGLNTSGGLALNTSNVEYISYFWKGSGSTSSNTDGTVTSTVDANPSKGFSIAKVSSTGTFGHGLSATPKIIIRKRIDSISQWPFYHTLVDGSLDYVLLNKTDANVNASPAAPTSTLFTNDGAGTQIFYCFAEITGYSKFGTYTGNNSTDGPIVNLGFEPAFLMIKRTDSTSDFGVWDNKKTTTNPRNIKQNFNDNSGDSGPNTSLNIDFLTNGFRIRNTNANTNASGGTYLYMAFAADPNATSPTLADSFNAITWTGNGGSNRSFTGLGFQPNLVWAKSRSNTFNHTIYDSVRGPERFISSDSTATERVQDGSGYLTSFDSDGFSTTGGSPYGNEFFNYNGSNFVAWAWKATGASPTINTDGSIDSVVSANTNAGFSIVQWTGSGSAGTIGHGLSSSPEMIIVKHLNGANDWWTFHKDLNGGTNPATYFIKLNSSDAEIANTSGSLFSGTSPTSTVFSGGSSLTTNGREMIAYCFHSVSGFSSIGSYSGNSTSGRLINIGFQPDWVMIKTTNATSNWFIIDSARGGLKDLRPNANNAEETRTNGLTFVSNGFEIDDTTVGFNNTGTNYIYAAFKIN